jgi:glutamate carboxypeptidase
MRVCVPSVIVCAVALQTAAAVSACGSGVSSAAAQPAPAGGAPLSPAERRIVDAVDDRAREAIALLERSVNINSGTLNAAGVRQVAELMRPEFEAIGFDVRLSDMAEVERGPHLIAERRGTADKRVLLIGHLDTVFEPDSPFQRFERIDEHTARGPGVADMKGGNIVILYALRALHDAGVLEGATITVVLTGDEEAPGRPLEISRRDLIEAGRQSDVALGFEGGSREGETDFAVIARRSSSSWELTVRGTAAHSSIIFLEGVGAGAVYEMARILSAFYDDLRGEAGLTFSPGLVLAGTDIEHVPAEDRGTAFGKTNVIPGQAVVAGDLRTLTHEQLQDTRARMRDIVSRHLPRTTAEISFTDSYPAMPPTEENRALLARYDQISRQLRYGPVAPFDPAARGAADISFVSFIPGLDGLGPHGSGAHTVNETVDLPSIQRATARAALLIYRLTRAEPGA